MLRKGVVSDTGADANLPTVQPAPWYAEGLRFACTQCGNCCSGSPGFVWVTPAECERIAEALNLPVDVFIRDHTRRTVSGRRSLLEHRNGDCEFLDRLPGGKTRCSIHGVRPVQCRTWPFWRSNLDSPESWTATGQGCPGINKGSTHALPIIAQSLRDNGELPL